MDNMSEILNYGTRRVQNVALTEVQRDVLSHLPWEEYMGVFVVRVPGTTLPTYQEFAVLKDEYEAYAAKSKALASCHTLRREAYGPLEEQLDFMTKHGAQALIDRNLAIKEQFPKPGVS